MSHNLSDKVSFVPVDKGTVGLLRMIHLELLPVTYRDSIYEMIKDGVKAKGTMLYLHGDVPVGELCYKIDEVGGSKRLYIMTLGVLKTYQRMGFGKMLLEHVIDEVKKAVPDVKTVGLHTHVENTTAMEFYSKMGFTKGELEKGYYESLDNDDAFSFSKDL